MHRYSLCVISLQCFDHGQKHIELREFQHSVSDKVDIRNTRISYILKKLGQLIINTLKTMLPLHWLTSKTLSKNILAGKKGYV